MPCVRVCRSWRHITKELVDVPELSGKLTFPISVKQVALCTSACSTFEFLEVDYKRVYLCSVFGSLISLGKWFFLSLGI